jgi:ABC-type dipeptide/oligopeptide/nickel transport system permease subunit
MTDSVAIASESIVKLAHFKPWLRAWPVWLLLGAILLAALTGLGVIGSDWQRTGVAFLPPSVLHPLGTNALGQDFWALSVQALYSMLVGVLPGVLLGFAIGVLAGLLAGWQQGGALDQLVCLLCDVFEGLPGHLMLVTLAILAQGKIGTAVLFAALFWPSAARPVRVQTAQLLPEPFMDSAILLGITPWRRAFQHLLPLLRPLLAALLLVIFGNCIRAQMLLGFVGLDRHAAPSLGGLLLDGTLDALSFHFTSLLLALAISITLLLALDALARRAVPARLA